MNWKIDWEEHLYPPVLIEYLKEKSDLPNWDRDADVLHFNERFSVSDKNTLRSLEEDVSRRIVWMDTHGIQTAVLSVEQGLQGVGANDPEAAVRLMRAVNDSMYEAAQAYPGRFMCLANLNCTDVPAAVEELERCMKELEFVGVLLFTNFGRSNVDAPEYWPVLAKAAELGAVAYLHPAALPPMGRVATLGSQLHPLGYAADCSITLLRLICQGVLDMYPDLKLIVGHLGETLPFVAEKIDSLIFEAGIDITPAVNQHPLSYYLKKNIYVTTCGSCSPAVFRYAQHAFGEDHILYATDYPFDIPETIQELTAELSLSEGEQAQVFFDNAQKLLASTATGKGYVES